MSLPLIPFGSDRQLFLVEGPGAREAYLEAWRALDPDYRGGEPSGVLVVLDAPDPAAEWADPRTLFIGYTTDGRQARVAYFSAASDRGQADAGPPPGGEIVPFADQDAVSPEDVLGLWQREGVLTEEDARERLPEVLLVATDAEGAVVGVATTYLARSELLRMDMWHARVFVAAEHRRGGLSTGLGLAARDHLGAAYASGRDTRAPGMLFEVEYPPFKRYAHVAVWQPTGAAFIGENARGDHVRVMWFAGAHLF